MTGEPNTQTRPAARRQSPRSWASRVRAHWHLGAVLLLVLGALALTVLLYVGIEQRALRIAAFVAVCSLIAVAIVLVPGRIRGRFGLLATAFVTAAGVLPVLIERDDPTPNEPSRRSVNVDYAAQLLLQGPFSGEVPSPLAFESMNSRGTPDDPGAVEQVEIRFRISGDSQALASAYLQLYRTPAGAQAASLARFKRYTVQYAEFGEIQGDPEAFWLFANGGLLAGGTSGHIFCEAVAVPDSNAMVGVTNGVVAACLDYGEDAIRLATSD